MKRLIGLAIALVLVGVPFAAGDDPPKSPAELLKQLKKDVTDAQKKVVDLSRKVRAAKDDDAKKQAQDEYRDAMAESLKIQRQAHAEAIKLAKAEPKNDVALEAGLWVLPSLRGRRAEMNEVIDLLVEHHGDNKMMSQVVTILGSGLSDDATVKRIEAIADKSPHGSVKAAALYVVADYWKNQAEPRRGAAPDNADELAKKAEERFDQILKSFPDEIQFRQRTYGEAAKAALFEIRNLRIGKVAPDIEGEDIDGAAFKLSDYRGKVVMLDFWGHW